MKSLASSVIAPVRIYETVLKLKGGQTALIGSCLAFPHQGPKKFAETLPRTVDVDVLWVGYKDIDYGIKKIEKVFRSDFKQLKVYFDVLKAIKNPIFDDIEWNDQAELTIHIDQPRGSIEDLFQRHEQECEDVAHPDRAENINPEDEMIHVEDIFVNSEESYQLTHSRELIGIRALAEAMQQRTYVPEDFYTCQGCNFQKAFGDSCSTCRKPRTNPEVEQIPLAEQNDFRTRIKNAIRLDRDGLPLNEFTQNHIIILGGFPHLFLLGQVKN